MKASNFLKAVVPSEGVLFAATPARFEKNGRVINYYKHTACNSPEDLALACEGISNDGKDAYFALAGFDSAQYTDERDGKVKRRTQENAAFARSMWLDIDCGPEKPYPSQRDGLLALKETLKAAKLPKPTYIVDSGYGLHVYWCFTKDVPKSLWYSVAVRFKALVDATGLQADKVTSNIACVLRPVGTKNYKRGAEKDVKVLAKGNLIRFSDWVKVLATASKQLKVSAPQGKLGTNLNAALGGGLDEYPPSDAEKIADRCAVFKEIRELKGADNDEQQWYYALGVLNHVENSIEVAKDWSSGHEDYDPVITTDKLRQWEGKGPTLCDTMRELFPACEGCALKCKSPIVLGFPDPEHQTEVAVEVEDSATPVIETLPSLPTELDGDFAWVEGRGLLARKEDADGNVVNIPICSQFPVPEFIFFDKLTETYYVRVSARTAPYKWHSGDISLEVVQKGGINLIGALGGKCAITVRDDGKLLARYMKTWVDVIRQSTDLQSMRDQMGWQRDGSFLLGKTLYKPDGEIKDVVVARSLAKYAETHVAKGDISVFLDTIDRLYNKPNYQEYQFFWLASFGSILLKFLHSHSMGITLAAYSPDSGTGKTSVCKAAVANFGDPGGFGQQADGQEGATEYAITVMAGLRHNLPILIDEITGWDNQRIGKFLYRVSSGTGKVQGSADGGLRDNSSYNWNSVSYITSNAPIGSKMSAGNKNSQAMLARLFDVGFENKGFNTSDSALFEILWQQSGCTGAEFVKYVVKNQDKVGELCHKMLARLNKKTDAKQSARFWMMLAAATLTAAHLTSKLGMHKFDLAALEDWTIDRIKEIRDIADSTMEDVEETARRMMSDIQAGMIVTASEPAKAQEFSPFAPGYGAPRAKVTGRYIVDTGDVYIPISVVKSWCAEQNIDYTQFKKKMTDKSQLTNSGIRYDIGRGTAVPSARVRCWKLNLEKNILAVIEQRSGDEDGTQLSQGI